MSEKTSIAWTDHTFNPWWGCTKVSPGCDHCYAEAFDKRVGGEHWGKGAPRREFGDKHWSEPLKWDAAAAKAGARSKVFCASMADVMDDEAPAGARERLWALIDATPNLIWQLLTKRPQRYKTDLPELGFKHDNVWLGTTAENQEFYDVRFPALNATTRIKGYTSFVSYEPALGPISIREWSNVPDWIIFGGETGGNRRPCEQLWAAEIAEQCAALGVKFFMKQMSARTPKAAAELIPAELLVRQFPA